MLSHFVLRGMGNGVMMFSIVASLCRQHLLARRWRSLYDQASLSLTGYESHRIGSSLPPQA